MRNLLLRLCYDGTKFHGWQLQKTGERSVEGVLLKCWDKISKGETIKIFTSGRTDKGVHALSAAANFTTQKSIPPDGVKNAFNSFLPDDVSIQSATEVPPDFHARYSAVERTYLYKISKEYSLFDRFYAYYHPYPLDVEKMRTACRALIGEHDFSAFRGSDCFAKSPIRKMKRVEVTEDEEYIYLEFTANAFLYRMVRTIMGTLIAIGDGKLPPQQMKSILAGKDRNQAGKTAPPHGLYLKKIKYKFDLD